MGSGGEGVRPLKWGILGAARIASKSLLPAMRAAGAEIVAVGASTGARAEAFARAEGIPRAYAGYDAVLDDPEIDAVYLPLANGLHFEWAVKTARAGKSCLCEKPLVLQGRDARELHDIFNENHCRLQEAFMWRHHAQIAWMTEQIAGGAIGSLRRVHAMFSFTLDRPGDYRWKAGQGGGALWDIGCYCVNSARHFFGAEPVAASVRAQFRPQPDDVDESAAGWLDFGGGRMATLSCSFAAGFSQGIELLGTDGRAWIGQPWLQVNRETRIMIERNNERTIKDFPAMNAYVAMIEHFTRAVRDPSFGLRPAEDGLMQAAAMEGVLASARNGGAVWNAGA